MSCDEAPDWLTLPEAVRAGILAMVKAAGTGVALDSVGEDDAV